MERIREFSGLEIPTQRKKKMWGLVVAVASKISGDSHQKVPLQNFDSGKSDQCPNYISPFACGLIYNITTIC
jgi:hypothetical protein